MDIKDVLNWKKSGLFAAGVLFGTAGIKVLSQARMQRISILAVLQLFFVQRTV